MKEKIKTGLIILVVASIVFVADYSRVSLCKGVAIPYKCQNYIEYYFG